MKMPMHGTLTTATQSKCGYGSANCFAFRDPPRYAKYLHHAGFDIMNSANNHSHDFGRIGFTQTTKALHAHGIAQTGLKGEITVLQRNGVDVAFLGFAPYPNLSNLLDLQTAAAMVHRATTKAGYAALKNDADRNAEQNEFIAYGRAVMPKLVGQLGCSGT